IARGWVRAHQPAEGNSVDHGHEYIHKHKIRWGDLKLKEGRRTVLGNARDIPGRRQHFIQKLGKRQIVFPNEDRLGSHRCLAYECASRAVCCSPDISLKPYMSAEEWLP